MAWLGLINILVLLVAGQELFLEAHRRRYGLWRSTRERRLWADPDERVRMWQAFTRRDPDRRVELSRLVFAGVIVLCAVAGLALLGSGALTPSR